MAKVVWTDVALADVDSITSYVAQFNPVAADRLAGRFVKATEVLQLFPLAGHAISGGRRQLTTVRSFLVRYRVYGDFVRITEVRHGARRPNR